MSERIAIIDPDPLFAKSIQVRLGKSFPDIVFNLYTPDECLSKESGSLSEDRILYDSTTINEEKLRFLLRDTSIEMIPLNVDGFPPRKKDAVELSACITRQDTNTIYLPRDSYPSSPQSPRQRYEPFLEKNPNIGSRTRTLLSFTDPIRRESYISGCVRSMTQSGQRLIRLDLMPGISMRNPFRKRTEFHERNSLSYTGITEVLLKLESSAMSPDDLLQYVQVGGDGVFSFGLPDRSDDILDCRTETLLRLLKIMRKLAEQKDRHFSVLTVLEGLPFHTLRSLCPISEELHVLMPDDAYSDRNLTEWEIHRLFSSLPPSMLKFVSEPQRTRI